MSTDSTAICCRPKADNWLIVPVLFFIGYYMIAISRDPTHPMSHTDICGCWLIAVFLALAALFLAVWLLRARVIADTEGIRWRGLGRWKQRRWEEVVDYYTRYYLGKSEQTQLVVAFRKTRLHLGDWSNLDRLKETVTDHATQARAKSWGILGARPEDPWPRVFDYDTFDNRSGIYLSGGLVLWCMWFLTTRVLSQIIAERSMPDWVFASLCPGTMLLLLCAPAAIFMLSVASEQHRRLKQRITVTPEGILFTDGSRAVEATWAEVSDYYRTGNFMPRCVVVTQQGSFDFTQQLRKAFILRAIICGHAENAAVKEWESRDQDILGGDRSRWSGNQPGTGQRIYHYRTRTNRALLWLWSGMFLASCLGLVLSAYGLTEVHTSSPQFVPMCIFGLAILWGWWCYYSFSLRTDEEGIASYGPFRKVTIRWEDIQYYSQHGKDSGVTTRCVILGAGAKIVFWASIADVKALKSEITRRAIKCRLKGWQTR